MAELSGGKFGDVAGLRALLALDDLEFDVVAFLQAFVAFRTDGTVVNENIGTVITSDETEPLGIIEPLDLTFNARHLPSSVHVPAVAQRDERSADISGKHAQMKAPATMRRIAQRLTGMSGNPMLAISAILPLPVDCCQAS
jgi:hypothetical protein